MANQIAGTIVALGTAREYVNKSGNKDWIVEVFLDSSRYDQNTGVRYENYPSIEVGSQNFGQWQLKVGMRVRFDIDIRGRYFDKKDGSGKGHANSINAYKCEVLAQPQSVQQPMQQPMQMVQPMQQPMQMAQPMQQPMQMAQPMQQPQMQGYEYSYAQQGIETENPPF